MTEPRPHLQRLAVHYGILDRYERTDGKWQETSDVTRVALLAAMGIDASSEANCERLLTEIARAEKQRVLEPVRVVLQGSTELGTLAIRIPSSNSRRLHWKIDIACEDGTTQSFDGELDALAPSFDLPTPQLQNLPLGYHELRWQSHGACDLRATQRLIVAPATCYTAQEKIGERRALGIWSNLYSVRSVTNWGIGDFSDLKRLIEFGAQNGADFIGINPLHALSRDTDGCPYFPTSRLYRNFLYLSIPEIPEFQTCTAAKSLYAAPEFQTELSHLRSAAHLDYPRLIVLKRSILELLHRQFCDEHQNRRTARGQAYADYLAREGDSLKDFAKHLARDQAAQAQSEEIAFQCYLQFEIERQLSGLKTHGQNLNLAFGIYQDLALGSVPDGSDVSAFPDLFAKGASLGAPPDPFSNFGQEWGIVPITPQRLREQGYEYWRRLLEQNCKASGILRIDHVLGLVRQFWIPAGMTPADGAYVRYPEQDLFRILALESRRQQTIIVGEDLGTVPPGLRDTLSSQGILRSQVLYFEKYTEHNFIHPVHYARDAIATVHTHDLAPLAGYWSGRDLDLRHRLEQIASAQEFAAAKQTRTHERNDLRKLFREYGLLDAAVATNPSTLDARAFIRAAYLFLARTPCRLLGVSLDDLAEETEAINIPGLSPSKNQNWRRRMQKPLEELQSDPWIQNLLRELHNHLAVSE